MDECHRDCLRATRHTQQRLAWQNSSLWDNDWKIP